MMLKDGRKLFDAYTPAVHAAVGFVAGQQEQTFSTVAGPPSLPGLEKLEGRDPWAPRPDRGWVPYRGGQVELGVGLVAYKRDDMGWWTPSLALLGQLSALLKLPDAGTLQKVAAPVREGIQRLAGAGNKRALLSYSGHFAGAATDGGEPVVAGYLAVVRDEVPPGSSRWWGAPAPRRPALEGGRRHAAGHRGGRHPRRLAELRHLGGPRRRGREGCLER
ncbi:MAG: hypothetical protein R3F60_12020 [bacterium]